MDRVTRRFVCCREILRRLPQAFLSLRGLFYQHECIARRKLPPRPKSWFSHRTKQSFRRLVSIFHLRREKKRRRKLRRRLRMRSTKWNPWVGTQPACRSLKIWKARRKKSSPGRSRHARRGSKVFFFLSLSTPPLGCFHIGSEEWIEPAEGGITRLKVQLFSLNCRWRGDFSAPPSSPSAVNDSIQLLSQRGECLHDESPWAVAQLPSTVFKYKDTIRGDSKQSRSATNYRVAFFPSTAVQLSDERHAWGGAFPSTIPSLVESAIRREKISAHCFSNPFRGWRTIWSLSSLAARQIVVTLCGNDSWAFSLHVART